MEKARSRALTRATVVLFVTVITGRNGESPKQGIDTIIISNYKVPISKRRNGESPKQGIDTTLPKNKNYNYYRRNGESPKQGIDTHQVLLF